MATLALIGLGSNLGDRRSNLEGAIDALAATPGVAVRAVSSFQETSPVGGPGGQGAFLNAAAALETGLDAEALLDLLNAIEARAKRVRVVRWGARTLDLDLLLYGNEIIQTPRLTVPHPRMALRRFVLAPLNEVAPEVVDPITTRSIAELLANLDRRPSYLALHGNDGPFKDAIFRQVVANLDAEGRSLVDLQSRPEPPLDQLEGSLNAMAEDSPDRWLVTDFCPPLLWPSATPKRCNAPTFGVILKQGLDDEVILKRGLDDDSLASHLDFPHLVTDSGDPDQVVAEILSACAATRA